MRLLICIDDTDNLDSPGTGELAGLIAAAIEHNNWGRCGFVTRHQLFVHPDIPYTSHNSAMCFDAEIQPAHYTAVIAHASAFLARESAPGSDPGLCVVDLAALRQPEALLAFGQQAKERVLAMAEAYDLAAALNLHLSEHGGTGQGVIGALAGAGLRLGGNDGRLRGNLVIGAPASTLTVAALCQATGIDEVRALDGQALAPDTPVRLGNKIKTVLLDGRFVLLLSPVSDRSTGVQWQTCTNQQLKRF